MIKYQDNSIAYYYDRTTGKRIAPWNKFSNRYTPHSIRQQMHKAIKLKWEIIIVSYCIPILLILSGICLVGLSYRKKYNPQFSIYVKTKQLLNIPSVPLRYFTYRLLLLFLILSLFYMGWNKRAPSHFIVGISQWNENPDFVQAVQGFKDGLKEYGYLEGKNIQYVVKNPESDIENQFDAIQEFVTDKVNLIFTLTTPGTLVAKGVTRRTPYCIFRRYLSNRIKYCFAIKIFTK